MIRRFNYTVYTQSSLVAGFTEVYTAYAYHLRIDGADGIDSSWGPEIRYRSIPIRCLSV